LVPVPDDIKLPDAIFHSRTGVAIDEVVRRAGTKKPAYFGALGDIDAMVLPRAGEQAAHEAVQHFVKGVGQYHEQRDLPGVEGTSRLSPYLRFGVIHPRQVLRVLGGSDEGRRTYGAEIAWREFYADVLWHNPTSTWQNLQPTFDHLEVDRGALAEERFQQWARGETGYPLVDAGMRQLLEEGWMHNRVRMVVASFLVKHLHLDWRWGAKWFMWHLVDGDIASNQHGWQWTAGTGTDASPFYRVFNPTRQAIRFDPEATYVHRWIPELRDVAAPACLEPGGGSGLFAPASYSAPMIDADSERDEALRRLAVAKETARLEL
jgi:deoxyribodipyrimidine photo-lyase